MGGELSRFNSIKQPVNEEKDDKFTFLKYQFLLTCKVFLNLQLHNSPPSNYD